MPTHAHAAIAAVSIALAFCVGITLGFLTMANHFDAVTHRLITEACSS